MTRTASRMLPSVIGGPVLGWQPESFAAVLEAVFSPTAEE
jgi:hypothetical protein